MKPVCDTNSEPGLPVIVEESWLYILFSIIETDLYSRWALISLFSQVMLFVCLIKTFLFFMLFFSIIRTFLLVGFLSRLLCSSREHISSWTPKQLWGCLWWGGWSLCRGELCGKLFSCKCIGFQLHGQVEFFGNLQ